MNNKVIDRSETPIIKVENVSKFFPVESKKLFGRKETVKAVNNVSLELFRNETLGLVGESGCGKSTLGRVMMRLISPTAGKIFYKGEDITQISGKPLRDLRRKIQIVFQDPYASLNPRQTVEELIMDGMEVQKIGANVTERRAKVYKLMQECGLNTDYARRYPHEFSGGQRQRIGIARALALDPEIIICDEPVSALDVSIQAQILNLLNDLREKMDLTLVFISHDLGVVNYITDRIAVMYLGHIVEIAETDELFNNPRHPYTVALFNAIPRVGGPKFDPNKEILEGNIPSPIHLPTGCPFQDRCTRCTPECMKKEMDMSLHEVGDGHFTSCIHEYKL